MQQYNRKSRDELTSLSKINPPTFFGVEQSDAVLQWIWENFSAVAGDQPSFECWRECWALSLILEFVHFAHM